MPRRRPNPVREVVRDLEEAMAFIQALSHSVADPPPPKSPLRRIAEAFGTDAASEPK